MRWQLIVLALVAAGCDPTVCLYHPDWCASPEENPPPAEEPTPPAEEDPPAEPAPPVVVRVSVQSPSGTLLPGLNALFDFEILTLRHALELEEVVFVIEVNNQGFLPQGMIELEGPAVDPMNSAQFHLANGLVSAVFDEASYPNLPSEQQTQFRLAVELRPEGLPLGTPLRVCVLMVAVVDFDFPNAAFARLVFEQDPPVCGPAMIFGQE